MIQMAKTLKDIKSYVDCNEAQYEANLIKGANRKKLLDKCWNIYNPGIFRNALVESLCHPRGAEALVSLLETEEAQSVVSALEEQGTEWRQWPEMENWIAQLAQRVAAGDREAAGILRRVHPDWQATSSGTAALEGLLALLGAEEEAERCRAAVALGDGGAAAAVEPLIKALHDTEAVAIAAGIFLNEIVIGEGGLRILIEHGHVGMGGCVVEVEVDLFDIFAVIALRPG